jgi:IS5 family transposase
MSGSISERMAIEPPVEASVLVLFRKRINMDMIMKANEYMLSNHHDDDDNQFPSGM